MPLNNATAPRRVAASDTAVELLPENPARALFTVFNAGGTNMYLLYGPGTVSSTNFVVRIAAGGYFESPQPCTRGRVTAIWDATASESAFVVEFT